jgi:hypothetical protein
MTCECIKFVGGCCDGGCPCHKPQAQPSTGMVPEDVCAVCYHHKCVCNAGEKVENGGVHLGGIVFGKPKPETAHCNSCESKDREIAELKAKIEHIGKLFGNSIEILEDYRCVHFDDTKVGAKLPTSLFCCECIEKFADTMNENKRLKADIDKKRKWIEKHGNHGLKCSMETLTAPCTCGYTEVTNEG